MNTWLRFISMAIGWSVLCSTFLQIKNVHPVAIGLVWLVGFLWFTGWIIDGKKGGDSAVIYTVGTLSVFTIGGFALAGVIILLGG